MFKKLGISALAALMALGALSAVEAASSGDNQNALCCRGGQGGYCYNYNNNSDNNGDYCDGNYCRNNGRGCW